MRNRYTVAFGLLTIIILTSATIDLGNLFNYANQTIPNYITKDNTNSNPITDEAATLGRVLFYDKNLSLDNTISCASCHKQEFAFGDTMVQSQGINGLTGRHSMRLVNARFSNEEKFFWDERAVDLENQTTQPIQDHIEMGFSNSMGNPGIDSLITKLSQISYYDTLFMFAFNTTTITEELLQDALAQFVRSIQSFDSRYDIGRAQVNNNNQPFPNFTAQENAGKMLFQTPSNAGGAGCQGCHNAPEFDIDPNSNNNNIIGNLSSPGQVDLTNTRSPSLRDLVNNNGVSNGPFMHDGSLSTLAEVIDHYDDIDWDPSINPQLDNRLRGGPGGNGQNLNLTAQEKLDLEAFLLTMTGTNMYTDERWSDPFDANGNITLINYLNGCESTLVLSGNNISDDVYEASDTIIINGIIPSTAVVTLNAPNVIFEIDSEVELGATLTTDNVGCN